MKANLNEMCEYWVTVDLEGGDYQKLESSDDIMADCEDMTEHRYSSGNFESESDAKNLIKLIEDLINIR